MSTGMPLFFKASSKFCTFCSCVIEGVSLASTIFLGVVCGLVTRFVEVLPGAEQGISQTIANHVHARQQFEGKSLSDTQNDYAEMFRNFHAPKDEAA